MTRDQIQSILHQEYDQQRWLQLLLAILPGTDVFSSPQPVEVDTQIAKRVHHLGRVNLAGTRRLAVLEIEVADRVDLVRNRVGLRNFIARFIDQVNAHGVLAVFRTPSQDYRFTFAAKESILTEDGALLTKETAPRRYTYVLGPNEPCRTPGQRFAAVAAKGPAVTLEDLTDAFSVEKLNREFFENYKLHYQKFCAHLLDGDVPAKVFGIKLKGLDDKARDLALKPVRDFVKKLLGRLVFLHFLQKKGWLGCPVSVGSSRRKETQTSAPGKDQRSVTAPATEWGDGDPAFLKNLFDTAPAADQHRFHSRRLITLFFDTLNRQRKGDLFALTGTRVPYLNGGLFERDFENVEEIDFPAELFRDLLEFFGQYNFTIDENDPDDHEIGIDPEMLGHIFENLLEDNKDKGAFYTPKAIVRYMCQQSLIYYLKHHLGDRPELETLVRRKDVGDPQAKDNWIRHSAKQIEKLLDEVKICDPAIGSGAFPIGLLQEIYWIKLSLDWTLDRAKAKRDIIQHSIYGVDLDAGAVEIARLRFWLALVVEENTPRPLPNLDYKIMQGNSLLESFEGIDLSNLTGKKRQTLQLLGTEQTELGLKAVSTELTIEFAEGKQAEITDLISGYFDQDDHEKKQQLHRQIDELVLGHIEYNLDLHEERVRAVLDNARKELKRKQAAARGYEPTKREAARIAELEAQLAEVDRKRDELAKLQEKPERPFFLWHLFFQDAFTQGGFDIVIANPPYVRQESIKDQKAALQAEPYECYDGTADLLVYFYECAVKKLRAGGALTFITSNKFYRAGYGEKLRGFLARELTLHRLIDFGDAPVFEAIAYASILEGTKAVPPADSASLAYTWEQKLPLDQIGTIVAARGQRILQEDLKPDGWRLESPAMLRFLRKLRRCGKPLHEYVEANVYRGITTGCNEAFIIDRATRDNLIREHKSSTEVLKPYLRGKDVDRWGASPSELWLIFVPWHFPLHEDPSISGASQEAESEFCKRYPAIFKHLLRFKVELSSRNKEETGIRYEWYALQRCAADYWQEFKKVKIVSTKVSIRPTFALDSDGCYLANTSYFFPAANVGRFLLGLLNSSLFFAYARKVFVEKQGGWFEVQPDGLEAFPIPDAAPADQAELGGLVARVTAAKRAGNEALVQSLEREMDAIVFRLYALTPEEIALVQSATGGGKV
ncbi:MAG: TaqI-like C-terminal specificity domain-containing protein [Verrucomicrobiota bacterium]